MLVRAARRKARPEAIRNSLSSDQLYLPWLCPAYNAPQRDRRRWINIDNGSQSFGLKKRRNSKDASILPSRRALATAVGYRPLDDIPFEGLGNMPPPPPPTAGTDYGDMRGLSNLKPFDPSSPLYLGGSVSTAPQRHRTTRNGVGGDLSEMRSVFDACLQVGRVERAGVILRRIAQTGPDASTILELHNSYLRSAVEQIILNPSKSASQDIHKWFELDLIRNGILPNAETIAYMVKASLQSAGGRRERLVRRYMDMVSEDTGYQVLCLDVLTAQEVNQVAHICPTYNLAEEPEIFPEASIEAEHGGVSEVGESNAEKPIAFVRPTEQKGLGLKSLKQTLSLFSSLPRQGIDMATATDEERRDIQARLEEDAVTSAIDRWREESSHLTKMGLNTSLQTKSLGARMWRWQLALQDYLKEELIKVDASELAEKKTVADQERCMYGPFLRLLPPEKLAAVTILSTMTALGAQGVDKGLTLSSAIMAISHSVEDESAFEILQRNTKKNVWPRMKDGDINSRFTTPELLKKVSRFRHPGSAARMMTGLTPKDDSNAEALPRQWPMTMKAKVGACLMSALIETAKVPVSLQHPDTNKAVTQMQPAFMHSHQYKMGKKLGIILANKVLVSQLKREPVHSLLAKHLPMLVTPDPWTRFNKGGFISHPSKMMRIKLGDKDQRHYAEAAIGQGDMEQTFKGLDVLGKTSWQINQPVFDIMLEAWNSGEAIANIPPESPKLVVPPEPDSAKDPLERRKWIKEVKLMENTRSGLHSQRCFQNFQLEIARALRNETFYFPHNVDFRGRAYPIPPYLNHMGADHCRGLLRFGKGKELGEGGLKWLKIHLANVFGFDKASLSEREEFATKNLNNIYDSAMNSLTGKRWWLKAEDPWQCLAACIEIRNAIESGDPTTFISQLPIHQDGTCNGLQHYAALGGDSWGAKQVNLEPGDRPADVYTAVANLVKESIASDKEKGNPFAIILDGKVTRKTVKQTVMTNVYGVTYIGAKAQVRKQLVAAHNDLPNTETMNPGHLSSYIATKIFTALSTMFKGAHDIQYWLGECASRISMCLTPEQLDRIEAEWPRLTSRVKATDKTGRDALSALEDIVQFKSSVIWTTPLHMPVVQPYRKTKSKVISTHMQRISLSEPHRSNPVSKRKQLQGFPPNFIHSLDATHMLLSALQCDELGLSFAAVHDSFWTHAADIPTMNRVLRDTFIRIHCEDVIGRLATEFSARYKNCMYQAKIRTDSPLYQKILAWRESKHLDENKWKTNARGENSRILPRLDELMLERDRARLLKSSDPEEVAKGKAMVTPASIFERMAGVEDLAPDSGLTDMGLGEISTREARLSLDQEIEVGDPSNVDEVNNPLPGGTRLDAAMGSEVDETEELDVEENRDSTEREKGVFERITGSSSRLQQTGVSHVWLPLTFPPVPKKVSFKSLSP
jgi:DNA-directed RNA polymerase, mitochondrial